MPPSAGGSAAALRCRRAPADPSGCDAAECRRIRLVAMPPSAGGSVSLRCRRAPADPSGCDAAERRRIHLVATPPRPRSVTSDESGEVRGRTLKTALFAHAEWPSAAGTCHAGKRTAGRRPGGHGRHCLEAALSVRRSGSQQRGESTARAARPAATASAGGRAHAFAFVASAALEMTSTARGGGVKRARNDNDRGRPDDGREARRLVVPSPRRQVREHAKVRVATLCSGIEAVVQAYENAHLPHVHVAACEIDPRVRSVIGLNFTPRNLFPDVTRLDVNNFPEHDMLWAGFPCQPFSSAGSRAGFDDDAGRGEIILHIIRVVIEKMPRVVVLENVGGMTGHRAFFNAVLDMFKEIRKGKRKYIVDWRKLDTKHFGIPQSRPRIWIVCVRVDVLERPLVWPTPGLPCTTIDALLGPRPARLLAQRSLPPPGTCRINVLRGIERLQARGVDPFRETHIIEIDHSQSRQGNIMQGCSPCLTRARAQAGGHWISTHGRRLGTEAMLKLQGMRPNRLQLPPTVSANNFNAMIGNSMSVNIIEALLRMLRHSCPTLMRAH